MIYLPYTSYASKRNLTLTFKLLVDLLDDILAPDKFLISIERDHETRLLSELYLS
jgi:hypothetical protein